MKNEKQLWFKAKSYGWGWYPITWAGWFVVLFYVISLMATSFFINGGIIMFVLFFVETVILILISNAKGEKPEWRWGGKKVRVKFGNSSDSGNSVDTKNNSTAS